jgi:acetate kinase
MKILVINTGSSSIKYQLFDMDREEAMVSGLLERIGEGESTLTQKLVDSSGNGRTKVEHAPIADHAEGLARIADLLIDPEHGVIKKKSDIAAVGHRVVHGGEDFQSSTIISDDVLNTVRENIPLAPLHNPPNLVGIEVAKKIFPEAPQVAVFDTAFHHSLPRKAYIYAIPYSLYGDHRVRRYGFHGTSHAYVTVTAAQFLGRPKEEINLITIHLGNGASMAAVKQGRSVDTTMGLTPLEGLVIGTRSGDVDPALPYFLSANLGLSITEIDRLLNKESGLKGLCGINDMREVEERAEGGDDQAQLALDVYAYRIKKYIGAYYAALGRLDAIVFTAGIGENSPLIRRMCCTGLQDMGILLDEEKNAERSKTVRDISTKDSRIRILVIPTNEEKRIARETKRVISQQS